MSETAVIRTQGLTKHYGRKVGCEDIDLTVPRGHVFGFLGQNGAGKSTFVKMMVGLIEPTSGRAELLGRPLHDFSVRRRIGFLPENFRYQEWLMPVELLAFHARVLGMAKADVADEATRVLRDVGLADEAHNKIKSFSKGMQQRLGLACALFGRPDVLFLDEPTSALDPIGRRDVRALLAAERDRGVTVFLNSHMLSEIEMLCDDVAFIKSGRVVQSGKLADLLRVRCEVEVGLASPWAGQLNGHVPGAHVVAHEATGLLVELPEEADVPTLVASLAEDGAQITSVNLRRRSLEALFLETVGEDADA